MTEFQKGAAFTHSFDVSEQIYRGFVDTFKDRNPFHMDDEAARDKGFAHKVMHGNILCGFLSYFVGECLPLKSVLIHSRRNPVS